MKDPIRSVPLVPPLKHSMSLLFMCEAALGRGKQNTERERAKEREGEREREKNRG